MIAPGICIKSITLRLRKGPIFGAGQSVSNHFHIYNINQVCVLLVGAAIAGRTDDRL